MLALFARLGSHRVSLSHCELSPEPHTADPHLSIVTKTLTVSLTTRVLLEAAFKEMYRQGESSIKTEIMPSVFDSQDTMRPTASGLQPVSVKVTAV